MPSFFRMQGSLILDDASQTSAHEGGEANDVHHELNPPQSQTIRPMRKRRIPSHFTEFMLAPQRRRTEICTVATDNLPPAIVPAGTSSTEGARCTVALFLSSYSFFCFLLGDK